MQRLILEIGGICDKMVPIIHDYRAFYIMNNLEEYMECWEKQRNRKAAIIRRKLAKKIRRMRFLSHKKGPTI
jgi:hypothetical protein